MGITELSVIEPRFFKLESNSAREDGSLCMSRNFDLSASSPCTTGTFQLCQPSDCF